MRAALMDALSDRNITAQRASTQAQSCRTDANWAVFRTVRPGRDVPESSCSSSLGLWLARKQFIVFKNLASPTPTLRVAAARKARWLKLFEASLKPFCLDPHR